ncbi:MAG: PAS domain S-box protein [Acidobacteria bacterium]|nr:PAS domain S-box protein [Acidobacteriota bacterium]
MKKQSDALQGENARLQAENENLKKSLQQSQQRFFQLFHASPNPITINTLKEGRIIDLNDAYARIGGFKREELIGRSSLELGLWADPRQRDILLRELQERGKVHNFEVDVLTKANETRKLLLSVNPIDMDIEPCLLIMAIDLTEIMQRADALIKSEEKYRKLVENSLQGLSIYQDKGLVFCNKTHADIFGYSIEELLASIEATNLIHPEDRDLVLNRYSDLIAGKPTPAHYEHRIIRKDGEVRWLEINASLIEFNGKPAVQVADMDVTERKSAEKVLRESEEQFRLIAETIDEVVWIYDPVKDKVVYVSPTHDRIYGYSREILQKKQSSFFDYVHPDDCQKAIAAVEEMKSGQPLDNEFRIIRPDGSVRFIWDRSFPIKDEKGQIKRFIGVAQDVTTWRRSEEALKESTDYLDQIINCISDPVFVKDYQHKLVLVNEAMSKFIGIPREKMLGKTGFELVSEKYVESLLEQEAVVLRTGNENVTQDTLPDADGNNHILMTKKTLLTKKSGEKQIVGVVRDITEYKRLEAQFLHAQKMEAIGALAGGVAHDFNNLLTVITGYVDLLKQDHGHVDSSKKDLEQIERAVQHATSLTSQLLAFSRKQILNPRVLDLNAIISDMNPMIRRLISENIEYETTLTPEPGAIKADPMQIQQIVMNLVVNARDAMPGGGRLTIATTNVEIDKAFVEKNSDAETGRYVLLTISDNGIGMDPQTRSRIFEPFFTTKETGKGTGLGLSTVYGIVQQSGGYIQIDSEYKKGTSCRIYLPVAEAAAVDPESKKNAFLPGDGKETILVVEDEPSVRILTGRILRRCGYHVLEAENGEKALDLVRNCSEDIHLILTDAIMPGMNGKELVTQIHSVRPGIRVLYVSGYMDDTIVKQGILNSSIAFLQKPFTANDLIRKVQDAIRA